MLFPEPLEPTSAVVLPAGAWNDTCFKTGTPGLYSKLTSSKCTSSPHLRDRCALFVLLILGGHLPDLANSIQAGKRLSDLRPDRGDLHQRRGHQAREEDVRHEIAQRHRARQDCASADDDHQHADNSDDHGRHGADGRDTCDRRRNVTKQAVDAAREHDLLALLDRIRLDDTDAPEGFVEPPRDRGIDLPALPENRPQPSEGKRHANAKGHQDQEGDRRQLPIQIKEDDEGDGCGDETTTQVHEPSADQVPDPFSIGHDPRDEDTRLCGVEVTDRQARHMRLHLFADLHDGTLGCKAQHLRERERGDGLHERGRSSRQGERHQEVGTLVDVDLIDQKLRGGGQHQPGEAIDEHQPKAQDEPLSMRQDELSRLAPDDRQARPLLLVSHYQPLCPRESRVIRIQWYSNWELGLGSGSN